MNNIRCLIVDDEVVAQRIIAKYLNDLNGFEIVARCANAMEAMKVLQEEKIDLMFLDIEMPKLKGLAFLKTLKNPPAVIITTAHRAYALEGYDLDVLDYLLKPIAFERFIQAVNKYKKHHHPPEVEKDKATPTGNETLYVKSDRKTIKIAIPEITHLEGMNNYVIIYTTKTKHIVYRSLTDLLNELPKDFIRIHKSYVVQTQKITSFTKEQVTLEEIELPIGRTYRAVVDRL